MLLHQRLDFRHRPRLRRPRFQPCLPPFLRGALLRRHSGRNPCDRRRRRQMLLLLLQRRGGGGGALMQLLLALGDLLLDYPSVLALGRFELSV